MPSLLQKSLIVVFSVISLARCFTCWPLDGSKEKFALQFPLSLVSGKLAEWKVVNANKSISVPAAVPGTVHTDLMRAGVLGDPYYRMNDVVYKWVADDDWTYSRTLNVSAEILSYAAVWLDCHGLDTVATIRINGKLAGSTSIMFHRYVFDIKAALKEGSNQIDVTFSSPTRYAVSRASTYPYVVPPVCPPPVQNGECSYNFIRKEASSFSWDWGPSFPTIGIWKPIFLRVFNTVSVSEFTAITMKDASGSWHVQGMVFFDVVKRVAETEVTVVFTILNFLHKKMVTNVTSTQSSLSYNFTISKDVQLWWPHTHGAPTLYNLTLRVETAGGAVLQVKKRIGFRTIQLVQEPIPGAPGLSFYFRVNGLPVFMKGSNWIPADSFQERITSAYVRQLLTSARDAHMNMLRVWGGGIYESDVFYDIADELGILIWQDLMFACALYPTDAAFLNDTQTEVRQQVRRLMSHPSIGIWSGNNENEAALATNWYNTSDHYKLYYQDYVHLYVDTLRPIVLAEDPSRPFITSSPTNGVKSDQQGWVSPNPYDTHYGDLHYYNYTSDSWDWRTYPVARFVSEYGLQSWCSYGALLPVSEPADRVLNSSFYQHRQHRIDGNKVLERSVAAHLPLPHTAAPEDYFKHFIYLTQIDQAVAIKAESELLRRSRNTLLDGNGHTMGALYWQLNDIWQAPTWASIEYGGKWKMLHYYAKNFFSRTLISSYMDRDKLIVYYVEDPLPGAGSKSTKYDHGANKLRNTRSNQVLKDTAEKAPQLTLVIRCYRWSSLTPLRAWTVPFSKVPAAQILAWEMSHLMAEAECAGLEYCFFLFSLNSAPTTPTSILLPSYPKDIKGLQNTNIKITKVVKVENQFEITLTTDNVAVFVWLDNVKIRGRFSDNGFVMVEPLMIVTFTPWDKDITADYLHTDLTVTSLCDVLS